MLWLLVFITIITMIFSVIFREEIFWPSLTNIIMAAVTAAMAIYTKQIVDETKRNREESKRSQKEMVFQKELTTLLWNIVYYDEQFHNFIRFAATSNMETTKDIIQLKENMNKHIPINEEFLGKVIIPGSLIKRILGILLRIKDLNNEIKNELTKLCTDKLQHNDLVDKFSLIENKFILFRFFHRQIACYILTEAKRQGFAELVEAIKDVSIFEPTRDMVKLNNTHFQNPFFPLPPEPDEFDYGECKCEKLLLLAQKNLEKQSFIMEIL